MIKDIFKSKKEPRKPGIIGALILSGVKPDGVYFNMSPDELGAIRSNLSILFNSSVLPADYDPDKYDIQGEYEFKVVVKKK